MQSPIQPCRRFRAEPEHTFNKLGSFITARKSEAGILGNYFSLLICRQFGSISEILLISNDTVSSVRNSLNWLVLKSKGSVSKYIYYLMDPCASTEKKEGKQVFEGLHVMCFLVMKHSYFVIVCDCHPLILLLFLLSLSLEPL